MFEPESEIEAKRLVEAIIFASKEPLTVADIAARAPNVEGIEPVIDRLIDDYANKGINLVRIGNGYSFRTAADLAPYMRHEVTERRKLSRAAIETLAIIAYHQPCTRAEVEDIRGVSVSKGTLDLLLELEWIRMGRRRETPGRPVTFLVTDVFLDHFGLSSAKDLPGLDDLRLAGLLDSTPQTQEPQSNGDDGD